MSEAVIGVRDLTMAYGDFVLMRGLDFDVRRGEVFVIMGGAVAERARCSIT